MENKLAFSPNPNLKDSVVLVTGGGGTIGSELVLRLEAKTIIAVDISEYAIYRLQRQIKNKNIHCVVGDISDLRFCKILFKKYKIDYVFNCAAYKHVDTLEDENNTYSVVKNNIFGVLNLCKFLDSIKTLIHISSDKAVYPNNSMGYTKLWCERIFQYYANQLGAKVKIVRFGNVYNSAGSFVETLRWQMENNMPITVTDDRMKRYFLTINDAVCLINEVVDIDNENATYILDMGEEIGIVDLVEQVNSKKLPITYIGIRPGEKLREQLVYDYENLQPTKHPMISVTSWKSKDILNDLASIYTELSKEEPCIKNLTRLVQTTTIL